MTSRFSGWIQAFLLSVAIATSAHGSDILLNTDFSDGQTHWRGDGDATGGGLVITLNPDKWTAVSQRFNADTAALKLTVTYSFSQDCTLGQTGDKLIPPLTPAALNDVCGVNSDISIPVAKYELWKVLVLSGDLLISVGLVTDFPDSRSANGASGEKTYTTDINAMLGSSLNDCTLCLCFPPGQGSVTLTGVKLSPPGQ